MPQDPSPTPPIEVRCSPVHGMGAFAARALQPGEVIGVYAGRRYTARKAAARDWNPALTFAFGLSDGSLLDGSEGGNATRHINHSCEPNCVAYEIVARRGRSTIQIEALRRVEAGEELFIDYALQAQEGVQQDYPCRCGARACRGTLLGSEATTSP